MNPQLPNHLIEQFADFLEKELGLHYPKERHPQLLFRLSYLENCSTNDKLQKYIENMLSNKEFKQSHIDSLSEILTIGETFFFRPGCGFEELEKTILPKLLKKKQNRSLRIWSAGCCTGEEAYSIAILLDKILTPNHSWNIRVIGTDINKKFLKQAQESSYQHWSFRNTPKEILTTYFTKISNNEFRLIDRIRSMVNFSYLNLVEDFYPSIETDTNSMDLILCNNTLMYFSPSQIQKAIEKFTKCLLDDSYFIVSDSETSYVKEKHLVSSESMHIFEKRAKTTKKEPTPQQFVEVPKEKKEPQLNTIQSIYEKGE